MIGTLPAEAARYLTAGEVVALPTETVYGLAANAYDVDAVAKVFTLKQRPHFDPLIVHVAHWKAIGEVVDMEQIPSAAYQLAKACWPGPLTLVLPKREQVPDLATAGLPTVGVRMPSHPLMREVLETVPFPLAAPSANPFGYISPTTAQHVVDQLGEKVPYVLDGGPSYLGLESTIVGFVQGEPILYRHGSIPYEALAEVVGNLHIHQPKGGASGPTPGTLPSHYAPRKPLYLGDLPRRWQGHRVGCLLFDRPMEGVQGAYQEVLSPQGDLAEAAQRLFAAMRRLDAAPVEVILAAYVPGHGLGRAINDRLQRAAAAHT